MQKIEKISKIVMTITVRTITGFVTVLTVTVLTILLIFSISSMKPRIVGVIRHTLRLRFVPIHMKFCNWLLISNGSREKSVTVLTRNKCTVKKIPE